MIEDLRREWSQFALKFNSDHSTINFLWHEIERQYTHKTRHYHNLSHINSMLTQVEDFKSSITNYDAFLLAVWYHDIIYEPTKKNNEERSALLAKKRLKTLNIDDKTLETVQALIVSTKKHEVLLTDNIDNSYLLDIDLSILGANWETYQEYLKNIRKEYAIFPNFMYRKGRKKVLRHFLERETLYFTKDYQTKFEKKARENLSKELNQL